MNLGHQVIIIIPNYGAAQNEEYVYEGLKVIKYAEPSVVDRDLIMGKRKPDGLPYFLSILNEEKPDIVHFHEIAGSNGITYHHVKAAKQAEFKVVTTFHLMGYTAISDSSVDTADIFNTYQGSLNFYKKKGFHTLTANFMYALSLGFRFLNFDTSTGGKLGTALSVPVLVEKKRHLFEEIVRSSDKIIAISKWYYEVLRFKASVSESKLMYIPQAIPAPKCRLYHTHSDENNLRMMFVGRISHFKGVKFLIEAIKGLEEPIFLDIYGDSGEDEAYINQCNSLARNADNIQFKGRLSSEKVMDVMNSYDVLVLPTTIHEMAPLVIQEAFAAGIPVLASDGAGSAEQIIDGVNGWLFRMNDQKHLQEKLKYLSNHPEVVRRVRGHVKQTGSYDDLIKAHSNLYKTLLHQ